MKEEDQIPSISVKTRKFLWGRSGNRCAMCKDKIELIVDIGPQGDASIIGEEAHIVARKTTGPRGESHLPLERRNDYDNLILLCRNHHKIIDDNPEEYPIDLLQKIKIDHQNWVKENLETDSELEKDTLIYLQYLEVIEEKMNFRNWQKQCMYIISHDQIQLNKVMLEGFKETLQFIENRIWPHRYIDLENAFLKFSFIINDFLKVFIMYSEETHEGNHVTRGFYKINDWDPDRYNKLFREYKYHNYLLVDLLLELTRAGNHLINRVRKRLTYFYRIEEGVLTVEIGNHFTGTIIYRTEYLYKDGNSIQGYNGLQSFALERTNRDLTYEENKFEEHITKYI